MISEVATTSKPPQNKSYDLDKKIRMAITTLGLKGVNAGSVITAHKIANKYSNLQYNQLLNKLTPTIRNHYVNFQSAVPSDLMDTPINTFQTTLQKLKSSRKQLTNSFDPEAEEIIVENVDPPMVLVLKRKGVRLFPDGGRVALYTNEKLGLTFTVPYSNSGYGAPLTGVSEETEALNESEVLEEGPNVQKMGRKKLVKARIRGGKIQRRKVVSAVKGYTMRGGKLTRMPSSERLKRKISQRKAKIKRKAKAARAIIKRKRSLRRRKALGL